MEELGRAAKARRSNHAARTYLEALQEREQREKVERGDAPIAAASPAVRSGMAGDLERFPISLCFMVRGNVTGNQY